MATRFGKLHPMATAFAIALTGASVYADEGGISDNAPNDAPQTAAEQAAKPAAKDNVATAQPDGAKEMETVVVTGTGVARTAHNSPISVTQVDKARLEKLTANSQADILATVKGLKAEGGGGEVAANVQVRTLPSSGQYQFTPLEYDGVPVLSSFGLNSSAFDAYARNDLGIDRLEYVSGGVSNLFGPGSVAGIINYISKTGGTRQEGVAQFEIADRGRQKIDFATSGPIDENNVYAFSGWYRRDDGPLETGLTTKGFQLRGNFRHYFGDGSGSFTLYAQAIDDKDQFFVPVPLDPNSKERINGVDGNEVYSLSTDKIQGLRTVLPGGGVYTFDHVDDGVSTKGGALYAVLEKNLAEDWTFNAKVKGSKYAHRFALFDATDGTTNVPETLAGFVTARGLGGKGTPVFAYAGSGQSLAPDQLVVQSRFTDRYRPNHDVTGEFDLSHTFEWGEFKHDLTAGTYFASARARDYDRTVRYLTDFKNSPDLVGLTFADASGKNTGTYSYKGLTGLVSYTNNWASADRQAFYIADQAQGDRWAFDVGYRFEHISGDVTKELSSTQKVDATALGAVNPLGNLASVSTGTGTFQRGSVSTTSWDLSGDVLFRLSDEINLYANLSRGFFFPELRSVTFNAHGTADPADDTPQSYKPEIIRMAEFGAKFKFGGFTGSVAGFWDDLKNRRNVAFADCSAVPGYPGCTPGQIVEAVNVISTRGHGVEFDGNYRITDAFSVSGNLTLQDDEYTRYDATPAFVGNELLRKPKVMANLGAAYDDGAWDATIFDNYQGLNYANDSQAAGVKLKPYHLWRAGIGYRFPFANNRNLHVGLDVFNLTNSQGLAEGNPRAFNSQTGAEAYFVGRPILPRRYTLRLTYKW
jgi:outer membrane receptor protein involved in Fe transport